jgi:hypothetical protein
VSGIEHTAVLKGFKPVSRGPVRFKQSDAERAIRAVENTGGKMAVEITKDGTIRIVPLGNSHGFAVITRARPVPATSDESQIVL